MSGARVIEGLGPFASPELPTYLLTHLSQFAGHAAG